MPLRLNVKPGERIFLGTSSFVIDNSGTIGVSFEGNLPLLRETDYIWPHTASTPLRRFYCALQDSYLTSDTSSTQMQQSAIALVQSGFPVEQVAAIQRIISSGSIFKALKSVRQMLVEDERVASWADVVSYDPEGFL